MFSRALIALALSVSALANVFITDPTATSTINGGDKYTIKWMDDGKSPKLEDFGMAKISIYVGNAKQQTSLQLAGNVDVSKEQSLEFTPDPSIGPNGSEYFIRVESVNLKDAAAPQFPALAFSAKFTMSGMTGKFSDDILKQIAGQTTAPIGGSTASSTGAPSSATLTTSKVSSATSSAASKSGSASTAKSTNGAGTLAASGLAAVVGAAFVAIGL